MAAGMVLTVVRGGFRTAKRIAIDPGTARPAVVAILALIPSIVAGILFFQLVAVEMLVVGAGVAAAALVASRLRSEPLCGGLFIAALAGVALVGPGASPAWAAAVALVAVGLELARDRYAPRARLQAGLVAYALVWFLSRGGPAFYVSPGSAVAMPEPVGFWPVYFGGGQAALDPVRLYVGNVAGPVFATSVLAVVVGASWLWYSRRLSLVVVLAFMVATVPAVMQGWSPAYELLNGPLWFATALLLADRRNLPQSPVSQFLVGLIAGSAAMGLRAHGLGIEPALAALAAVQVAMVGIQGSEWLVRNRQLVRARWHELRSATEVKPALPGPS